MCVDWRYEHRKINKAMFRLMTIGKVDLLVFPWGHLTCTCQRRRIVSKNCIEVHRTVELQESTDIIGVEHQSKRFRRFFFSFLSFFFFDVVVLNEEREREEEMNSETKRYSRNIFECTEVKIAVALSCLLEWFQWQYLTRQRCKIDTCVLCKILNCSLLSLMADDLFNQAGIASILYLFNWLSIDLFSFS